MPFPEWLTIAGGRKLLAGLKGAAQGAKDVERLKLENEHLRERLTLREQLDAAGEKNRGLRTENDALRARLKDLETAKTAGPLITVERNAVWVDVGTAQQRGPFCQTCYGAQDGKLVPLNLIQRTEGRDQRAQCGNCKNVVSLIDVSDVQSAPDPPRRSSSGYLDWRNR